MPGTWAASAGDLSRTCLPQMLTWAEREHSHQEMKSRVLLPRACPSKTLCPLLPCSCPSGSWQPAASLCPVHVENGVHSLAQLTPQAPLSLQLDQITAVILCEASVWGEGGWVFVPSSWEVYPPPLAHVSLHADVRKPALEHFSAAVQASPALLSDPADFSAVKGAARVRVHPWGPSLPHRYPPRPTSSILMIFFPSYYGYMEVFLAAWVYRRSLARFQLVFFENCSTHRCIFDLYVGQMSSVSASAILIPLPRPLSIPNRCVVMSENKLCRNVLCSLSSENTGVGWAIFWLAVLQSKLQMFTIDLMSVFSA